MKKALLGTLLSLSIPGFAAADLRDFAWPGWQLSDATMAFSGFGMGSTREWGPILVGSATIARVGDMDGDGLDDVLIADAGAFWDADRFRRGRTMAFLYLGSGIMGQVNACDRVSMDDAADLVFVAEETGGDETGLSVAGAGHVNTRADDPDGVPDILIGAYGYDGSGGNENAGKTYLFLGESIAAALERHEREIPCADADFSFAGGSRREWSGYNTAGPGDVNLDGYADILIGAYGYGRGSERVGKTYLFSGARVTGLIARGDVRGVSCAEADVAFEGEGGETHGRSGACVSGAGDATGDGYPDILIGAHSFSDRPGTHLASDRQGKTYLFSGARIAPLMGGPPRALNCADADFAFVGEGSDDSSGCSVASAGDVDGDGCSDILIGAYNADGPGGECAGKAYLVLGSAGLGSGGRMGLGAAGYVFTGEQEDSFSGISVAGPGDVDGDRVPDILIGAYGHGIGRFGGILSGGEGQGKSYLLSGARVALAIAEGRRAESLASADYAMTGVHWAQNSGYAVAGAGDVNGDRASDVLIFSPLLFDEMREEAYYSQVHLVLSTMPGAIYVDGSSTSPAESGTPEQPFRTIQAGIAAAARSFCDRNRVIVRGGWVYREVIELAPGVEVAGEPKRCGRMWLPPILYPPKPVIAVRGADHAALAYFTVLDGGVGMDGCSGMRLEESAVLLPRGGTCALRLSGTARRNVIRNNVCVMRTAEPSSGVVCVGAGCDGNRFVNNTIHGEFVFGPVPAGAGGNLLTGVFLAAGSRGNEFLNIIVEMTERPDDAVNNTFGFRGDPGMEAEVAYCRTTGANQGMTWGAGNIVGGDPAGFVRPVPRGFDYRLAADSPCRDAGHPSAAYTSPATRRNDMGAYGGPDGFDFR